MHFEIDPDDELDSIDVPIHVAGETTGIGPAPFADVVAAPDPTSSRRVGDDGRVTILDAARDSDQVKLAARVALLIHDLWPSSIIAVANSEHFTSFAPSIKRAKS